MSDLGTLIHTTVGLVPDGVVVFLPSYAFLNQVKTAWDTSGLLARLGEKKQVSRCCLGHKLSSTWDSYRFSTNRKSLGMSSPSCGTTPLRYLR